MHRSLVALSLVLATGGWVCDSADPCPGELTCSSDVAGHVCCPQGSPYLCGDACSTTPQCSDYEVCKYPDDPGSDLCTAGAYAAMIDSLTCSPPSQPNTPYGVSASGTLIGCGPTPVAIQIGDAYLNISSADCGTWVASQSMTSTTLVCTPGTATPASTQWHINAFWVTPPTPRKADVSITVEIASNPVIAQMTKICP